MASYIVYAWFACLSYSIGSIVGKLTTKHHVANPWLYNFLWFAITNICIVPLALLNGVGLPQHWQSMLILSVANTVSGILFTLAFYAVDISVLSPLANIRTPLSVFVGYLFFHEFLTLWQQVLIGVIFIAGIFVQYEQKPLHQSLMSKKMLLAVAWICSSIWFNSMIKETSIHNGFWEVSLWSNVLGFVFALPTIPLFIRDIRSLHISRYSGVVVSTILYTAGFLFTVRAVGENVGISMAIISLPLSMLIAIAFSVFAPKLLEKHPAKVYAVRLSAAAVMFFAAMGLSG